MLSEKSIIQHSNTFCELQTTRPRRNSETRLFTNSKFSSTCRHRRAANDEFHWNEQSNCAWREDHTAHEGGTLSAEPRSTKSNMAIEEPNLAQAKTLNELPRRTNARKEQDEPGVRKFAITLCSSRSTSRLSELSPAHARTWATPSSYLSNNTKINGHTAFPADHLLALFL